MLLSDWVKENSKAASDSLTWQGEGKGEVGTTFKMWSVYPFITRDVSFWSDGEITQEKFITLVGPALGALSICNPYLIDQFQKDGRHSYAFRFVFQSYEKTLTDNEVEGEWSKILEVLKTEGFEIR